MKAPHDSATTFIVGFIGGVLVGVFLTLSFLL